MEYVLPFNLSMKEWSIYFHDNIPWIKSDHSPSIRSIKSHHFHKTCIDNDKVHNVQSLIHEIKGLLGCEAYFSNHPSTFLEGFLWRQPKLVHSKSVPNMHHRLRNQSNLKDNRTLNGTATSVANFKSRSSTNSSPPYQLFFMNLEVKDKTKIRHKISKHVKVYNTQTT